MRRFNFLSLHDRIRRRDEALNFAQEHNIIKSDTKCKTCANSLKVQYSQANTSYVFFYCQQCKTKESVKKDTFLYNKVIVHHICKCLFIYVISRTYRSRLSSSWRWSSHRCQRWLFQKSPARLIFVIANSVYLFCCSWT